MYITLMIIVVVAAWLTVLYNTMIKLRNQVKEGWSDIDVQLKQRYNVIPNLLNTIKEYEKHESVTFTDIAKLRSNAMGAGSVSDKSKAEAALTSGLGRLFAVAENYPDLKSSQNFLDFQTQLSSLEDKIQKSRRYYNGTARDFNTKIQSFPNNIFAGMFHFTAEDYFEIDAADERAVPNVDFNQDKKESDHA